MRRRFFKCLQNVVCHRWKEVSDAFSNEYFVIIPELDAHTQEEASEFISVDDEAVKIRDYLQENGIRYTPAELAEQLNQKGLVRNKGKQWSASSVSVYMSGAGIKTKTHYYTELGYLTGSELCKKVGISHAALTERYHRGWYEGLCVKVTDHLIMYHPDAINVRKKPN